MPCWVERTCLQLRLMLSARRNPLSTGGKDCIQLPSTYVAGYWRSKVPHGRRFQHSRNEDIIQKLFGADYNQPWFWGFAHTTFGYK